MGLDISKITNEELKNKALQYDENGDNKLSTEEIKKAGGMSVFDGVNPEAVIEDTFQATGNTTIQQQRAYVLDRLADYIKKGGLTDNLMNTLRKELTNPDYADDLESVENLLEKIKEAGYGSKKDIDKLSRQRNQIKEQAANGNEVARGYVKVYDAVVEVAKADVLAKEIKDIINIYNEVKTGHYTNDEKAVKDKLRERKLLNTSYYREAFKEFKKYLENDKVDELYASLAKAKGETRREVKQEVIADHKPVEQAAGKKDVSYRQTVRRHKDEEAATGRYNKVYHTMEELKKVSADELKKVLGKDLFIKLDASFLSSHKNPDGTYDVSEVSKALIYAVSPTDPMMNRSEDEKTSEMFHARAAIGKTMGLPMDNISNEEVKKIMDLCNVPMEPRERKLLKWGDFISNLITGGVSGGLGAYSASAVLNVTQSVTLTMDTELATDMMSQLASAGINYTANNVGGETTVSILQEVFVDPRFINVLEGLATGLGVAILTTVVKDLLIGENQKYEKSCISLNDEGQNFTSFKEFVEWAQNKYPERARSLELMARIYTKPGTDEFDGKAMYEEFRNIAGRGSNLNCLEGVMAMIKGRKPEPVKPTKAPEPKEAVVTKHTPEVEQNVETEWDKTHIHKRKYGDGWPNILQAYYPELNISEDPEEMLKDPRLFGPKGLIRKFQKALAYEEDGTFNKAKYDSMVKTGNIPANIKIPSEFEGCQRVIRDVIPIDWAKHNKGKKAAKTDALKMVGHDEKGVDVSKVKVNGQTVYVAKDKADPSKSAQDTTRDGAVAKLEAQQGVKYDIVTDL